MFDTRDAQSPCYHCLFGEGEEIEETRCATMGVFAPLTGIVGATQAAEALKLIAGVGTSLAGRLLLLDALAMHWREMRVPRDPRARYAARGPHETLLAAVLAAVALAASTLPVGAAPPGHAVLQPAEWTAIKEVIGDQLQALKAGDGTKAMTYSVPGIRQQFRSPERFMRMVRDGYGALLTARDSTFLEGAVVDGITLQPLQLVLPDNSVVVALYRWKSRRTAPGASPAASLRLRRCSRPEERQGHRGVRGTRQR